VGSRAVRSLAVGVGIIAASLALGTLVLCADTSLLQSQLRAEVAGPPLQDGARMVQTIPARRGTLVGIDVLLATFATTADGTLRARVSLLRESESAPRPLVLAEWSRMASAVRDNEWHQLPLDVPQRLDEGDTLLLELWRDDVGGHPVTAWTSAGDAVPSGELVEGGTPVDRDLAFRVHYERACREAARDRLASTGLEVPLAGLLFLGVFALPMAFLYTYARCCARSSPVR
jgi:hypothetical protein